MQVFILSFLNDASIIIISKNPLEWKDQKPVIRKVRQIKVKHSKNVNVCQILNLQQVCLKKAIAFSLACDNLATNLFLTMLYKKSPGQLFAIFLMRHLPAVMTY
jgi:hypothetical protein